MAGIEVVAVDEKGGTEGVRGTAVSRSTATTRTGCRRLRIAVKELLDRKKHPFYANAEAEFFLARQDGRVVGRIAAIIDRASQPVPRRECRLFRLLRDASTIAAVADALLDAARAVGDASAAPSFCAAR